MPDKLLEWRAGDAADFGRRPLAMRHKAHLTPLFSDAALIRLIDSRPRDCRDPRQCREGDRGDLSGAEVFEAIVIAPDGIAR